MKKSHISKTTHIKNHITPLYISILSISKYTPKLNATQTQQIAHNGLCLRYLYDTNAAEDTIETRVIIISLSEKCMPSRVIDKRMDSCEMIRYMIQKQIWKENIKRGKK